jgi:hypothetical protein
VQELRKLEPPAETRDSDRQEGQRQTLGGGSLLA